MAKKHQKKKKKKKKKKNYDKVDTFNKTMKHDYAMIEIHHGLTIKSNPLFTKKCSIIKSLGPIEAIVL